jgi:hypothetical protein
MTGGPRRLKQALDMSTAAFSIPDGSRQRVSITRRGKQPTSATSAAADEALRQIIDGRRRRNLAPEPRETAVGNAIHVVKETVSESVGRMGLSRWALRAIVLGGVGLVLMLAALTAVPRGTPLHGIAGSVSVNGKPLVDGMLELHLTSPSPTGEPFWLAVYTSPSGDFRRDASAGVPAGTYAVVVKSGQVAAGRGQRLQAAVIPVNYTKPTSTPLTIEIKGSTTALDLVVRK